MSDVIQSVDFVPCEPSSEGGAEGSEDDCLRWVRVRAITRDFGWNPLEQSPWFRPRVRVPRREIAASIQSQEYLRDRGDLPFSDTNPDLYGLDMDTLEYHVARIAYLVVHGWSEPIDLDIGVPGVFIPTWGVTDGNHRLAAAIYRGDKHILALCSGVRSIVDRISRPR